MAHSKNYHSVEEWQKREKIFYKNVNKIQKLNDEHEGRATFKINAAADMTVDEFMKTRGGLKRGAVAQEKQNFLMSATSTFGKTLFKKRDNVTKPVNFDWRTAKPGVIAPVKDQGICGSCWAFSAISAIESANALKTGAMTLLPEQFVIDCNWKSDLAACDGGESSKAIENIVSKWGGIVPTADSYGRYLTVDGYCRGVEGKVVGAKVADWVQIPTRDDEATMQAVLKQPLSIAFNVADSAIYYDSGIIDSDECKKNTNDDLNHAINLVGYGTDKASGKDYWVIRNSWSTYWGDQGYFKVVRGEKDCGVTTDAGYPVVEGTGTFDGLIPEENIFV